ncbi:MAG: UDP-glucuronic acid decarboxylase family protein [Patescibacteria group bacterium]
MSKHRNSWSLVTGGAGFIGSHLCDALLARGEKVICVDNLFTGRKENIQHLLTSHDGFQFLQEDIVYWKWSVHQSMSSWDIGIVYNLACPASPVHYQHDPVKTVQTNVVGTWNMLELAKSKGAIFLQASTSEVYGDPEVHPQPESYVGHVNPLGPRACYDEGKRCAETLCSDYHREFGQKVKIARIFNTYGPRMAENDGRVVSNFILQALKRESITIFGDGSQTRSFQYVTDLVRGLLLLADHPTFAGPVNIGTQYEMKVLDLAQMIIRLTGSRSTLTFEPLPQDDPKQRRPDTALAERELGWKPLVSVEEGLRQTIEDFRGRLR